MAKYWLAIASDERLVELPPSLGTEAESATRERS